MQTGRRWIGPASIAALLLAVPATALAGTGRRSAEAERQGTGSERERPQDAASDAQAGRETGATRQTKVDPRAVLPLRELTEVAVTLGKASADGGEPRPGATVGKLRDFVLDRTSGALTHAVVATSSGARALEARRLCWNEEASQWVLALSPTQFAQVPAFELDALEGARPVEAGAAQDGALAPVAPRHVLLSELSKARLVAADGPLGTLADVVLFADAPAVAFLLVKPGPEAGRQDAAATPYSALPWSLCRLMEPRDDDMRPALRVEALRSAIQAAPTPSETEGRRLSDVEFRSKLYTHYGVQPPDFDMPVGRGLR